MVAGGGLLEMTSTSFEQSMFGLNFDQKINKKSMNNLVEIDDPFGVDFWIILDPFGTPWDLFENFQIYYFRLKNHFYGVPHAYKCNRR